MENHRAFVFGFIAEQVQRPFSSLCGTHLLLQGSLCNNLVGLRSPGLRLYILRNHPFAGAGMRRSVAPSPNFLLNLLWAYAAHTRDYFPFTRKVIKGVPKRKCPLWKHLWRGKTAPLFPALSCFFVCGPENGQSPFSELFCRKVTPLGNFA